MQESSDGSRTDAADLPEDLRMRRPELARSPPSSSSRSRAGVRRRAPPLGSLPLAQLRPPNELHGPTMIDQLVHAEMRQRILA